MTKVFEEVLTVEEAAEYLKLSERTVRILAKEGKLPGKKVGNEWRFSKTALSDNQLMTIEEVEQFLKLSKQTLLVLSKEEKIPAIRFAKEWRFSKKALLEWLGNSENRVQE